VSSDNTPVGFLDGGDHFDDVPDNEMPPSRRSKRQQLVEQVVASDYHRPTVLNPYH
jgi:hypothetical protein